MPAPIIAPVVVHHRSTYEDSQLNPLFIEVYEGGYVNVNMCKWIDVYEQKKGSWWIRINVAGSTYYYVDSFNTKEAALEFLKKNFNIAEEK